MFTFFIDIIILLLLAAGIIAGAMYLLRWYLRKRVESSPDYKDTIFLIRVPKESTKVKEEKEKSGAGSQQENIKEKISLIQTIYANFCGVKPQNWFLRFFYGPQSYLSAEIVVKGGLIYFYLICPHRLSAFLEQQMHAQFPDAEISQEADYNIFSKQGELKAAYLRLRRNSILPIKTYKELETDPLNALVNSLSKIDVKDGAAIQILAHPKERSWSQKGMRIASAMQQGKSLKDALGAGINPFKILQKGTYGLLSSPQYLSSKPKDQANLSSKDQPLQKDQYRLSPLEEEIVKGIENKASQLTYQANIRIIACSEAPGRAAIILNNIINAFTQFDYGERGNGFRFWAPKLSRSLISDFIFRRPRRRARLILNTEELASLWHLPLPQTDTPNILWLIAKRSAPPVNLPQEGIILGKSVYRGQERLVRMKREDRRRHLYIIGKSGGGKSVLMSNLAIQDVQNGEGVCMLDPHGDLVESVLENIPKNRVDDVIYFDPSDTERPLGLNMLEYKTEDQMDFAVQEMIAIFYKLFPPEMIGPMFEHNMRNVMLTLMADKESPGTIADIPRMFTDKEFQQYKLTKVKDVVVRAFWEKEMAQTTDFHKSEMLGYLISKVGRFVENEMIRNIIGQPKSGFDFREVMDKKKILLINLSKGKTGEVNSSLLGLIIVAKLQMAAMARAGLPENQRPDFYLYIDEFQNFVTDSIATILSEARKYRLDLIIAHQYLGQLIDEKGQKKILDAVLGNAGTIASFRIGVEDAETIAKEFAPIFNEYDVINIEQFNAYIKLLIDNTAAKPFNMQTFPPKPGSVELSQSIKELSRLKFGRPRAEVEADILDRTKLGSSS
ncbi:MAG: type IV secretory system conjugative DNA transfer family protein, partial [Candidatus Jacksonbacteria bacterium]